MTLTLPSDAIIVTNIRFDFLINDYRLVLRTSAGQQITHGLSDGTENRQQS